MDALGKFEETLEEALETSFTRALRSPLQPVEIAKRLARAMERERTIGSGEVWAPNQYEVRVSPRDYAGLDAFRQTLERRLAEYVAAHARERGLSLLQAPAVTLLADGTVPDGRPLVAAELADVPKPPLAGSVDILAAGHTAKVPVIKRRRGPALVGSGEGQIYYLDRPAMTVGRALDNDIILDDRSVSRHHARINRAGTTITVTDLGSANGTWVGGRRLAQAPVAIGDSIAFGSMQLTLRGEQS